MKNKILNNYFYNKYGASFLKEIILTFALAILAFIVLIQLNAFGMLVEFIEVHENYELDDLITLSLVTSIAFIVITLRNTRYLNREVELREASERKLNKIAYYDVVTGLPNRSLCKIKLEKSLSRANRTGSKVGVFFIDLDNFKHINDSFGHDSGDELLILFSRRMSALLRKEDTLARISGDEFVVIIDSFSPSTDYITIANKLLKGLEKPFSVFGKEIFANMSIGISVFPDDSKSAEGILKSADAAMYHAKQNGKGCYSFYSKELEEDAKFKLKIGNCLRKALHRKEFTLYYQPILDVKNNRVLGAEALLRWDSIEIGRIPPDIFVPIMEQIGLMNEVGSWVIEQACLQNKAWHDLGYTHFMMSVNMSAKQLSDNQFVNQTKLALERSGLSAKHLEIELTETALLKDIDSAKDKLSQLRNMGISIALDDFGTGYSSLSYIVKFDISRLKIDKSFISNVQLKEEESIMVRAIIALATSLNLSVTAEGIETESQKKFIESTSCDAIQGYLISKPLPVDVFNDWLVSQHEFCILDD